jgi:hypothetical protein
MMVDTRAMNMVLNIQRANDVSSNRYLMCSSVGLLVQNGW